LLTPRRTPPSLGGTFLGAATLLVSMSELLSDEEIEKELPAGWERDGDEIVRTFEFDEYLDGIGFASGAGGVAEDAWHHPEMTIGWCEVTVRLTTHDAGGITENDIDMATRLNEIYE
jgi:4a-hydroxytetrahydrobiopterin dehydratase